MDETSHLKSLGSGQTRYLYDQPSAEILESFVYSEAGNRDTVIEITFPEFTSLCPKTGQPDFATIHIVYIPKLRCVESKSLKLYFFAFRNHGAFMESIVNKICNDLVAVLDPKWLEVRGDFNPRGGLRLVPTASHGTR